MGGTKVVEKRSHAEMSKGHLGNIGKFQIIEKIGEGGSGQVYKCFDPDLQVLRAVKLPFDQTDEMNAQLDEARLQAGITHPNIVQIHSVERIDGKWAIIMDYAEGGSLRDRLESGKPLSVDDAVKYTAQIAGALREAHEKKVLHHDIKPENILFSKNGIPMVADFGIARIMRTSKREMSKIMGTVSYMAPEQLEGRADLRSDIWSIGVVLYEMLTGNSCFAGKTDPEVIKKIVMDKPRPIRELNPSLPEQLGNIVMRMLGKDPGERYQTFEEVVKDLDAFRVEKWVEKRKPLRWLVPLGVTIFLVACGVVYGGHTGLFQSFGPLLSGDQLENVPAAHIPEEALNLPLGEQLGLAKTYIDEGKFPLAYHLLGHVAAQSQDESLAAEAEYLKASVALHYMDLPNRALAEYKSLIQKYPGNRYAGNAHYFAGWIYYERKNDLKKAIMHLTTVLERYPESSAVQTAELLVKDAAKRLAEEGPNVGLVVKSFIGGFLPNNWMSLLLSILGFIPFLTSPIAWILTQYHKPEVDTSGGISSRQLLGRVIKTPGLKALVIIVIVSQIISFAVTQYQSRQDFENLAQALRQNGVAVKVHD
ncbi:MAG: protein kinase [Pseudomonadota bacterium]